MLEIPSIIRIIAEIHLLKLCDLEPQGYRVRDSNHFTYAHIPHQLSAFKTSFKLLKFYK